MTKLLALVFAAIVSGCGTLNEQIVATYDNAEDFVVDTAVAVATSLSGL